MAVPIDITYLYPELLDESLEDPIVVGAYGSYSSGYSGEGTVTLNKLVLLNEGQANVDIFRHPDHSDENILPGNIVVAAYGSYEFGYSGEGTVILDKTVLFNDADNSPIDKDATWDEQSLVATPFLVAGYGDYSMGYIGLGTVTLDKEVLLLEGDASVIYKTGSP